MTFECRLAGCGASFTHARNRSRHERLQHQGQLYACGTCSAQYKHYHELVHHERAQHETEQYTCEHCCKTFKRRDNYIKHVNRHREEYNCADCGKVFSRPDSLKRHAMQHTDIQTGAGVEPEPKRQRYIQVRDHFILTKTSVEYSEKFRTTSSKYTVTFNDIEIDGLSEILSVLHDIFGCLISDITEFSQPTDIISISVQHSELEFPISFPFVQRRNLNGEALLSEIEHVLQSYQEFVLDATLQINVTHVALPRGSGKSINLEKCLQKKRCVIQIDNKDEMCLARAIITAKAKLDDHVEWDNIRRGRSLQRCLAEQLHELAGVPIGPCGLDEVKIFQHALTGYQINIVSKDHFNSIIYSGPDSEKRLYLYFYKEHFSVITSMPAFFERHHWCVKCNKPYDHHEKHSCIDVCHCCFKIHSENGDERWITCKACNRYFKGNACYENHIRKTARGNSICTTYYRCSDCGKTIDRRKISKHVCGEVMCKVCNEFVTGDHRCYMKVANDESINGTVSNEISGDTIEEDGQCYIFFDFETVLEDGVHRPNLCVAHKVCVKCIDRETDVCEECGDREYIFYGDNTRDEFCEWLFGGDNKGAVCIAHNAKGFDSYFILKYLHQHAILPDVIFNGSKIMSVSVKKVKIKIIDSLNFLPMPLSKLPSAFGLTEDKKGYFPYLYNTKENENADLTRLPDMNYYNPKGMKTKDRKQFETWYRSHQTDSFNMKEEMLAYCINDVSILRRCCTQFRKLFMATTSHGFGTAGIDPFKHCITIASACNLVFRTKFLKPETIAIIPPQGYHPQQKQSIKALKWIKFVSSKENVRIEHAANGKERKIGPFPVDGYYEKNGMKTVLQFQGCYFHGCLKCYARTTVNAINQCTMGDLHTKSLETKAYIEKEGFSYREIWECEYDRELQMNEEMRLYVDSLDIEDPLNPRDAFFGGRTEGFKVYYEVDKGEKIKYLDFTSLYPSVNKYEKYVAGHPTILTEDIGDIDQYEGLIKCKIVPPRHLYLPVLPAKIGGKLLFALCRTCAETKQQHKCQHTDDERAFVGTWVSDELKQAIGKGYTIMRVYEVWHFDSTSQYDRDSRNGGLFTEYIDTFLKIKQEASGWPSGCITEDDKQSYIRDYYAKEGVQLEYANIGKNPGLRSLAKLILNSFWGKFGQRTNSTKTTYTSYPQDYFDMLTSDRITVHNSRLVNSETAELQWSHGDEFIEPSARTNVVVAAYTTAHARLKLYRLLDSLGERVIYADTDSCIFSVKPGEYEPEVGQYLGELTDEVGADNWLVKIICAGPKNYAYQLAKPDDSGTLTCCKVRGITLNSLNSQLINFDTVSEMVKGSGPNKITVVNEHKICRDRQETNVINKRECKDYRITFDKRIIVGNYCTIPYGY